MSHPYRTPDNQAGRAALTPHEERGSLTLLLVTTRAVWSHSALLVVEMFGVPVDGYEPVGGSLPQHLVTDEEFHRTKERTDQTLQSCPG